MKALAFLLALVTALVCSAQSNPKSLSLPPAHYDVAEFVFRQYMVESSDRVFHLGYGAKSDALPGKFMERFTGKKPLVRGALGGTTVVDKKLILDKFTRREAIRLSIVKIGVTADTAQVRVIYSASYTSHSALFELLRTNGGWHVKERKLEWIACG
jgi:hypothetical protein